MGGQPQSRTKESEEKSAPGPERLEPSAVAVVQTTLLRPRAQSSIGDYKSRKAHRPSSEPSAVPAGNLPML
jgi:hypothetical protein